MANNRIHVGTSGWNYAHWRGNFYPEELKKKEWFEYYSERFSTVEINYSFYSWPSEKTLDSWQESAPSGFRFTLKANRLITHKKNIDESGDSIEKLYSLAKRLKGKFACFLFQLPPHFRYNEENLKRLKSFVGMLDSRKRNVIEFRDRKWWREEVYGILRKNKIAFCSVSGLGMPEDLIVTSRIAYLRLHGKDYRSRYTKRKLKRYADKIQDSDAKEVFIYFNNDAKGYAPKNAKEIMEMI